MNVYVIPSRFFCLVKICEAPCESISIGISLKAHPSILWCAVESIDEGMLLHSFEANSIVRNRRTSIRWPLLPQFMLSKRLIVDEFSLQFPFLK